MELRTEGLKAQDPQYERGGSRTQAKERQREQMGMIDHGASTWLVSTAGYQTPVSVLLACLYKEPLQTPCDLC